MNEQLLTNRQLFNLKPKTLENRITHFLPTNKKQQLNDQMCLSITREIPTWGGRVR